MNDHAFLWKPSSEMMKKIKGEDLNVQHFYPVTSTTNQSLGGAPQLQIPTSKYSSWKSPGPESQNKHRMPVMLGSSPAKE